ncbi:hypothetical protein BZA77DRAFT_343264 [Pyronema omphalodes]|nr:hypothetical protein BZA77DRAFT_343264 [Pyronema omphalodes]
MYRIEQESTENIFKIVFRSTRARSTLQPRLILLWTLTVNFLCLERTGRLFLFGAEGTFLSFLLPIPRRKSHRIPPSFIMDASSFYDTLLASIGAPRSKTSKNNEEKPAPAKPVNKAVPIVKPPPPAPEPSTSTDTATIRKPEPITTSVATATPIPAPRQALQPQSGTSTNRPIEVKPEVKNEAVKPIEPPSQPHKSVVEISKATIEKTQTAQFKPSSGGPTTTNLRGNAPSFVPTTTQAPTALSKSSTALEEELRSRLLASRKRKAVSDLPRPPPQPQSKRPPRGSPVFTAVPLANNSPVTEDPNHSFSEKHVISISSSPIEPSSPARAPVPAGKLALPPKPAQRDGFRLRIKLPLSTASSGFITMETDKLPLSTPLSAILDLFNRRTADDHLYFASPSTLPDTPDVISNDPDVETEAGQRFYRFPPKGVARPDVGSARLAPCWDSKGGNIRATLEDVAIVSGAEVVECEIRSEPRRYVAPGPSGTENKRTGFVEDEEMDGYGGDQEQNTAVDTQNWQNHANHSPVVDPNVQGFFDPFAFIQPPLPVPLPQPWLQPWAWSAAAAAINWIPDAQGQPQPQGHENTEHEAPRWIPGHKDYTEAGWMFGFGQNDAGAQGGQSVEHDHRGSVGQQQVGQLASPLSIPRGPRKKSHDHKKKMSKGEKKKAQRGADTSKVLAGRGN